MESTEVRSEYDRLIGRLRKSKLLGISGPLELEHGGHGPNGEAPCVTHTHVHLLPDCSRWLTAFDDLPPHQSQDNSYIWTRWEGFTSFRSGDSMPGQGIRRRIGSLTNSDEWDWAIFPKYDVIHDTIESWRKNI